MQGCVQPCQAAKTNGETQDTLSPATRPGQAHIAAPSRLQTYRVTPDQGCHCAALCLGAPSPRNHCTCGLLGWQAALRSFCCACAEVAVLPRGLSALRRCRAPLPQPPAGRLELGPHGRGLERLLSLVRLVQGPDWRGFLLLRCSLHPLVVFALLCLNLGFGIHSKFVCLSAAAAATPEPSHLLPEHLPAPALHLVRQTCWQPRDSEHLPVPHASCHFGGPGF